MLSVSCGRSKRVFLGVTATEAVAKLLGPRKEKVTRKQHLAA